MLLRWISRAERCREIGREGTRTRGGGAVDWEARQERSNDAPVLDKPLCSTASKTAVRARVEEIVCRGLWAEEIINEFGNQSRRPDPHVSQHDRLGTSTLRMQSRSARGANFMCFSPTRFCSSRAHRDAPVLRGTDLFVGCGWERAEPGGDPQDLRDHSERSGSAHLSDLEKPRRPPTSAGTATASFVTTSSITSS